MSAFLYSVGLHLKLNLRNKEIVVSYYVVPLVFYLFMGNIFTTIMPDAYLTLIQSMTVFGVTMGGVLGSPAPLVTIFGSEIKKSYRAGDIPLWTAIASNTISGFIHLFMMSLFIFFTAPFLFDAAMPSNMYSYFLSLFLLLAANLCVGIVFGLWVKNASKLALFTQFVFLPSVMLSGIMFPTNLLPEGLRYMGKIFPASWGFLGMCDKHLRPMHILPNLLIIVILLALSYVRLRKIQAE